jgi:outer membrane protein, multidrug efflux system
MLDRSCAPRHVLGSAVLLAFAAAAAGCAPTVQLAVAPEVLSSEWRGSPAVTAAALPESLAAAFRSPLLADLTRRAMARNADLGAATARVQQARAQMRIARAAMLPSVSASAGASATRSDGGGGVRFESNGAFAGIDVAYDLDLFGREAAGQRAARSRASAAAYDRAALALVIEGELARGLVQYAALGERLNLVERSIADAGELQRIIGVRERLGEATRFDTARQTVELRQLEAEQVRLSEARERTRNALAVLVGEEAPLFELPDVALTALSVPEPATVQPAMLLVRRPDIRAAEGRIAAAAGDVQRARAAFLPQIRLSASAIGEAASIGSPLAAVLSIGSGLLAPIFEGGRLRGELEFSAATQRESVELYRGALLTALGEAQNALTAVDHARRRSLLLAAAAGQARTAGELAMRRFLEGESDFQDVVDARAELVQAQDAEVLATQARLEAAIDLYRAMGGPAEVSRLQVSGAFSQPVTE